MTVATTTGINNSAATNAAPTMPTNVATLGSKVVS
jgi:hypothetical protein